MWPTRIVSPLQSPLERGSHPQRRCQPENSCKWVDLVPVRVLRGEGLLGVPRPVYIGFYQKEEEVCVWVCVGSTPARFRNTPGLTSAHPSLSDPPRPSAFPPGSSYEYALKIQPGLTKGQSAAVWDALALQNCPGSPRRPAALPSATNVGCAGGRHQPSSKAKAATQIFIFVCYASGSDSNPGTLAAPLKTIACGNFDLTISTFLAFEPPAHAFGSLHRHLRVWVR